MPWLSLRAAVKSKRLPGIWGLALVTEAVVQALKSAIAEMYLQGVSTCRVTHVMEELCGLEVTATQVSRLTSKLDESFEQWRNRPLSARCHPH